MDAAAFAQGHLDLSVSAHPVKTVSRSTYSHCLKIKIIDETVPAGRASTTLVGCGKTLVMKGTGLSSHIS